MESSSKEQSNELSLEHMQGAFLKQLTVAPELPAVRTPLSKLRVKTKMSCIMQKPKESELFKVILMQNRSSFVLGHILVDFLF